MPGQAKPELYSVPNGERDRMQTATDAGTQDATREVLGNRDLVRHMMSRAHEASRLLSVASGIRNKEECARLYEEWSANRYRSGVMVSQQQ